MTLSKDEKSSIVPPADSPPSEDVLSFLGAARTKLHTFWLRLTYPFAGFGKHVSIHYSCDLRRSISNRVQIGDSVYIAQDNWLNVPELSSDPTPTLIFGDGCKVGRRCMFSAKNKIVVEEHVLFGPGVLVTDHSHEYCDIDSPIHSQGLTTGGTVRIERNCWLGFGASIICSSGELVIGRNTVVGTNSVVTRSVPPFSVVAGNPARVVKAYDREKGIWVKPC